MASKKKRGFMGRTGAAKCKNHPVPPLRRSAGGSSVLLKRISLVFVPLMAFLLLKEIYDNANPDSTQVCVDTANQVVSSDWCSDVDEDQNETTWHSHGGVGVRWYYFSGTDHQYPLGTKLSGGSYRPPTSGATAIHGTGNTRTVSRGFFGSISRGVS